MIDMNEINFITVVLLGLSTWRISSMLCYEEGPFGIFVKIREMAGIEHNDLNTPVVYPDRFFGKLFECIWCLSVWVSATFVVFYIFLPTLAIYFSLWLSLSTICIMVNEWVAVEKE